MSLFFLPYLFIVLILFFFYLNEIGRIRALTAKSSRWIAYIIMWVFIGLRGHIMSDFISYYPFYEFLPNIFNLSLDDFIIGFEPGFIIYSAIIKTFTNNYFTWVAINTLIDLCVFAWLFRKYCSSMILPLIFFIVFNGLLIEFNLYRNVKAIDLFLLSIPYLQSRKFLPYLLLNLVGVTFHTSSILYIPLYSVLNKKMSLFIVWGGFIIANIVFLFKIGIIGNIINNISFMQSMDAYDKIMRYSQNSEAYGISMGYIERTFAFVYFFSLYKKVLLKKPFFCIFYNCFWIYYCTFLFFYEVTILTERIPYLFIFSYWILYPKTFDIKYYYRNLIEVIVSVLILMKIYSSYNNTASEYETCVFSEPNYEHRKQIYEQSNDYL